MEQCGNVPFALKIMRKMKCGRGRWIHEVCFSQSDIIVDANGFAPTVKFRHVQFCY